MPELLRAALFVPRGIPAQRWTPTLAAVAEAEGWQPSTLVRRWDDLFELMCSRLVEVGIVPSMAHLPPDRLPRIVAADQYHSGELIPGQRRPAIRWHPSRGAQPPRRPSGTA
jgi:hypothetical protein